MNNKFNPRIQKFIDQMVAYCGKKTATQCAIDSGFGIPGARTRASELMAKDSVRNEIERQLEGIREKWKLTKDNHFQELGELREMAKTSKNVNAAVRAEELRGKVAGLYIDRQILAATKMVRLPDGQMKIEQDMTADDYQKLLLSMGEKHNVLEVLPSKNSRTKIKKPD